MDTIYLVTTGDYSGYRIHSAWSSQELAEAYIDRLDEANEVEVFPIRSELPEPETLWTMTGEYAEQGEARPEVPEEVRRWVDDLYPVQRTPVRHQRSVFRSRPPRIHLFVEGTDRDRVAKVFSEQWAQIVADYAIIIEKDRAELEASMAAHQQRLAEAEGAVAR